MLLEDTRQNAQYLGGSTGSTIPSYIPRGLVSLQDMEIDREKVLRLIRSLDTKKAHGCDDISSSMIKMCDESIVEPLCLIFEKCLDSDVYPPPPNGKRLT